MYVAIFHCPNAILDQWRGGGELLTWDVKQQNKHILPNDIFLDEKTDVLRG